jgi:hypothetical protein
MIHFVVTAVRPSNPQIPVVQETEAVHYSETSVNFYVTTQPSCIFHKIVLFIVITVTTSNSTV